MLTPHQTALWEAYKTSENRAARADKLSDLNSFLDSLANSPSTDWFPWAISIAQQVVDDDLDFVVRRPLFLRALFPALLDGYSARQQGCARWLAGFSSHLLSNPECRKKLPPEETTELGLLRTAILHDPSDRRSRLRVVQIMANRLSYSIHELPSGVLYGMNGASPDECLELEAELDEFCNLVDQESERERHEELIRECRIHFRAYRAYQLDSTTKESYQDFVSKRADRTGN